MPSAAEIHLALNHFPIAGSVLALVVLVVARVTGNASYRDLALGGCVVVALLALATYWTGEPAEATVEHLSGVRAAASRGGEPPPPGATRPRPGAIDRRPQPRPRGSVPGG